jgi:uncharacterized membrane protein
MSSTLYPLRQIRQNKVLLASFGFAFLLLCYRIYLTHNIAFAFLLWNLFLAFIPLVLSKTLQRNQAIWKNVLTAGFCILFLPNAPYLLTDLFHLSYASNAWLWYDTLLILVFAWCGLLCYLDTLKHLEQFLCTLSSRRISILALSLLHFLCAFGIYIGRYMRFNSWDIVAQPLYLAGEIGGLLLHPFQHPRAWGMTLLYGIFLHLIYLRKKSFMGVNS